MPEMNRRRFLQASILAVTAASLGPAKALAALGSSARAKLALIIDDIGFSRKRAHAFLGLGIPITYAVLPRLYYTTELAREIHRLGHEIILHQPMEPIRPDIDPGPGALYVEYSPDRIEHVLDDNIATVPYAVGVNNHMGSRFTQDQDKVVKVMDVVKRNGLYFVDSLTTSRSRAYQVARGMHMAALRRHFFLDLRQDPGAVCFQLCRALFFARRHGYAVVIGHPHQATIEGLRLFTSTVARTRLIDWVYVSDLLA